MKTDSWWIGLTWEEFTARAEREAARMAVAKGGQSYRVDPHQFSEPMRRRLRTAYTYHLEAERVEA